MPPHGRNGQESDDLVPPAIHRALKRKAAASERSISEVVSEAVRAILAEDAEDQSAFEERASERSALFENVVKRLRRRGKR